MGKVGRLTGASRGGQDVAGTPRQIVGRDLEVLGRGADIAVRGNLTVTDRITHSGVRLPLARSVHFYAGDLVSEAAINMGDGLPRLTFPDGVTTSAFFARGLPSEMFDQRVTIGFDWVNDHTATGDVVWHFKLQGNDVGVAIANHRTIFEDTRAIGSPGVGVNLTTIASDTIDLGPPGAFGTLYSFTMERLGADAADTLAGPVGLSDLVVIRNDEQP